jgi:hypothetical protein
VTKIALKQAPNERGLLAEMAEVQREIDFCATLQTSRRLAEGRDSTEMPELRD